MIVVYTETRETLCFVVHDNGTNCLTAFPVFITISKKCGSEKEEIKGCLYFNMYEKSYFVFLKHLLVSCELVLIFSHVHVHY